MREMPVMPIRFAWVYSCSFEMPCWPLLRTDGRLDVRDCIVRLGVRL